MKPRSKSTYTPQDNKLLAVLLDGMEHTKEELHELLYDEFNPIDDVLPPISRLRIRLREDSKDIITSYRQNRTFFRMVQIKALNEE